jgi:hypothetical protein
MESPLGSEQRVGEMAASATGVTPRPSKFRFKSKKDLHDGHRASSKSSSDRSHRHHHRHHHRSKRHKTSHGASDDPASYDDTHLPNASSTKYMAPDDAFRESLFDAMADDEGAAFWEGVYGQPIHNYPNVRPGPEGELERMSDEEYTSYVRGKMWEKTHEHVMEERARREEERKTRKTAKEETRKMGAEKDGFERAVEESLKRGEERKTKRRWKERWEEYLQNWDDMKMAIESQGKDDTEDKKTQLRNKISWPVESGKRRDVSNEEVENFFRNAPSAMSTSEDGSGGLLTVLKMERVRWHPDKIQQRYGSLGIDEGTMKAVTAVFQVIDNMWNEERQRSSKVR